jgi:hypothetical protein
MCFVAFFTQNNTRWLLSNRDENIQRSAALLPTQHKVGNYTLLFPKDAKAGGTWVAVRNDGVAAVLLNGAAHAHISKPPYRHSRGFIIPHILQSPLPEKAFEAMLLEEIEPFTLVLSLQENLVWYQWDGCNVHKYLEKETDFPCWSSSTLYNPNQQMDRKTYWDNWAKQIVEPETTDFLAFAESLWPGDTDTMIKMIRANGLQTVSSTLISLTPYNAEMNYVVYPEKTPHFQYLPIDIFQHAHTLL